MLMLRSQSSGCVGVRAKPNTSYILDVFTENNIGEELEEPVLMGTRRSETTVPPEVPVSSNGAGSSDESTRPQSSVPHSGLLIIHHISDQYPFVRFFEVCLFF